MQSKMTPVEALLVQVDEAVSNYALAICRSDEEKSRACNTEECLRNSRLTAITLIYYHVKAELDQVGVSASIISTSDEYTNPLNATGS